MNGSSDIASYRLPLSIGMLVVLLVWELMSPYFAAFTQGEGMLKRRALNAATNLGFGLLNAVVVAGVFVGLWAIIATWSATHQFGLLHWLPLPAVASWMLAILLLDSWTYLWHRLNHVIPFLWQFHRLHHSDREMNVTTANRFHGVASASVRNSGAGSCYDGRNHGKDINELTGRGVRGTANAGATPQDLAGHATTRPAYS